MGPPKIREILLCPPLRAPGDDGPPGDVCGGLQDRNDVLWHPPRPWRGGGGREGLRDGRLQGQPGAKVSRGGGGDKGWWYLFLSGGGSRKLPSGRITTGK